MPLTETQWHTSCCLPTAGTKLEAGHTEPLGGWVSQDEAEVCAGRPFLPPEGLLVRLSDPEV